MISKIKKIQPEWCVGHFPFYPALPVAIVLSILSHSAGDLFLSRHPALKGFLIRTANVTADNLAFAGESLNLETQYLATLGDGGGERFLCTATTTQGLVVGRLDITIEAGDA